MTEERWHEVAHIRRLEYRVAELEALAVRPHELKTLHDVVAYLRAVAQTLPDASGDSFAAKMRSYSEIIEKLVERIEAAQ